MADIRPTEYTQLNDVELVEKVRQDPDCLGIVYKRCKSYSIGFMRSITSGRFSDYELDDVFHDAVIALYEKIVQKDFVLTASLQTYLNAVCRFKLLNRFKNDIKELSSTGNEEVDYNLSYSVDVTNDFEDYEDPKEAQFKALERALEKLKVAGEKCYELLSLYWYHNKSMNEIAEIHSYSNGANAKHQKSRCQEKLRKMAFNELNF